MYEENPIFKQPDIEQIYLAPNTPDWFSDLVKEIVSRYEYTFEVVHSKLDERPFF